MRVFASGIEKGLLRELELGIDQTIGSCAMESVRSGDLVILDAARLAGDSANRSPFCVARALKQVPGVGVVMLVPDDDPHAQVIARFCGVDACVTTTAGGGHGDLAAVRALLTTPTRKSKVDELLERYERKLESDRATRDVGLQRLISATASGGLMSQLSDPDTGLWDGEFASYKIDEELKRAIRMRQPLTLVLLDIGVAEDRLPHDAKQRRLLFAEVASVFLNETRDIDVLARFTPTVFLFLLPGTGHEGGGIVARRMVDGLRTRSPIAGVEVDPRAGLVTAPAPGLEHREAFLLRAEACLGEARNQAGGSGVCSSPE